jgi:hypothetical protein
MRIASAIYRTLPHSVAAFIHATARVGSYQYRICYIRIQPQCQLNFERSKVKSHDTKLRARITWVSVRSIFGIIIQVRVKVTRTATAMTPDRTMSRQVHRLRGHVTIGEIIWVVSLWYVRKLYTVLLRSVYIARASIRSKTRRYLRLSVFNSKNRTRPVDRMMSEQRRGHLILRRSKLGHLRNR